jgi:hypothetical protein
MAGIDWTTLSPSVKSIERSAASRTMSPLLRQPCKLLDDGSRTGTIPAGWPFLYRKTNRLKPPIRHLAMARKPTF